MKGIILTYLTGFLLLFMLGCGYSDSTSPGPSYLPEDNEVGETFNQLALVPNKEFFAQRGASVFWESLQQGRKSSYFNFDFANLSDIPAHINKPRREDEVAAGIIRYLIHYQVPIKRMVFRVGDYFGNEVSKRIYITSLPSEIGQLAALQDLNLSSMRIGVLPTEIFSLSRLKCLALKYNQLKELPVEIGDLINLENLDLDYNNLERLPARISELASLKSLDLYNNCISEIPAEISRLTNLQVLNLRRNKLVKLPHTISNLINLKKLDLSDNQLKEIPVEIGKLTSLEELDLKGNHLETLPADIFNLRIPGSGFNIRDNRLKKLPASITSQFGVWLESGFTDNQNWPAESELRSIDKNAVENKLREHLKPKSSHSLLTLCMRYIEENPGLFDQEKLETNLPEYLQQAARRSKLMQDYKWNAGKNIVFINKMGYYYMPITFYLDYPVYTRQHIVDMLKRLEDKQLYQITDTESDIVS